MAYTTGHKRLGDNVSSEYFEAANRMRPKNARRRIIAYVGSYDDVLFWRTLLSPYEDGTRYFEVMLPSHGSLERGKRSVLMSALCGKTGCDMIACVDADYDYVMQGATEKSRMIVGGKHVLHTYAYSIENLQCYAGSLHDVCVMVTLNDHAVFDFVDFFRQYSSAIYPLFVWSVMHYRNGTYQQFTITDFNHAVTMGNIDINSPQEALRHLRNRVRNKADTMRRKYPKLAKQYEKLSAEMRQLGITADNTYLYIQGHHLFDTVVVPLLSRVCGLLIREREAEIRRRAVHGTQMHNELSCYSHSVQDIAQMLKKNTGYSSSPQYRQIQRDVEAMLASG